MFVLTQLLLCSQIGAEMLKHPLRWDAKCLLAGAAASGIVTLILILVQVKDVYLPARTKVGAVARLEYMVCSE